MAILYGTQSNGETLPVLVDQFGNLLAKGIEGQQGPIGPEGPPGVGELPPNPFEGAILGWEDGELAWLSGSIILPAGTYGPYTYDSDSQLLDIPQDASALLNGQQLFMSDDKGIQVGIEIATDLIRNVRIATYPTLTFPTTNNFDKFKVGDVVQDNSSWNQSQEWALLVQGNLNTIDGTTASGLFNGVIGTDYKEGVTPVDGQSLSMDFGSSLLSATSVTISGYALNVTEGSNLLKINGTSVSFSAASTSSQTYSLSNGLQTLEWSYDTAVANGYIYLLSITVESKLLVDPFIPNPDAVKIIIIDEDTSTITTNGGSWKGTDGSGDQQTGSPDIRKSVSGEGSVQVGLNGSIVLRADNGEWIDGYFVTAPEQTIAARKASKFAQLRRGKKTK